jgi:hypothetical protein
MPIHRPDKAKISGGESQGLRQNAQSVEGGTGMTHNQPQTIKTVREIRLEKLLRDAEMLIDARPNGYWARLEEMAVRIKQELAE